MSGERALALVLLALGVALGLPVAYFGLLALAAGLLVTPKRPAAVPTTLEGV